MREFNWILNRSKGNNKANFWMLIELEQNLAGQLSTVWIVCSLYVGEESLISRFVLISKYLTLHNCVFCMFIFQLHEPVVKSLHCVWKLLLMFCSGIKDWRKMTTYWPLIAPHWIRTFPISTLLPSSSKPQDLYIWLLLGSHFKETAELRLSY